MIKIEVLIKKEIYKYIQIKNIYIVLVFGFIKRYNLNFN